MSWLKRYRQASYKNINFYVSSHSFSGGKRGKTWEYPNRDKPYNQILGNKARSFDINGYLVGDNYDITRDDFIRVLESAGSGKLIHPYLGEHIVDIMDYSITETTTEGAICRFSLKCVQSGELDYPITLVDVESDVFEKKINLYDIINKAFQDIYDILNVPMSIIDAAINTIEIGLDTLSKVKSTVSTVAEYKNKIKTAKGKLIALAYDAKSLAQSIIELTQFGTNPFGISPATPQNAKENFNNVKEFFKFNPIKNIPDDIYSPPNLISNLYQQTSIIAACSLLVVMKFDSDKELKQYKKIAIDELDRYLEKSESSEVYHALYDFRASVIQGLEQTSQNLPTLSVVSIDTSLPALVLSHNLYQTIAHEEDIIKRNNLINPAYVPSQQDVEVLVYE